MNRQIEKIAKEILKIETLKPIGSDRHDFQEVHIGQLKKALIEAYSAGYARGSQEHIDFLEHDIDNCR